MSGVKCKDRVKAALESRLDDFKEILERSRDDDNVISEEANSEQCEYGLELAYEPNTDSEEPAHVRYLISTGGPHEEFRIFFDSEFKIYSVEFVFSDWYDGASVYYIITRYSRKLNKDQRNLVNEFVFFGDNFYLEELIRNYRGN